MLPQVLAECITMAWGTSAHKYLEAPFDLATPARLAFTAAMQEIAPQAAEVEIRAELGAAAEVSPAPMPWLDALGLEVGEEGTPAISSVAPRDEEAAAALVAWAGRSKRAFCVVGGATKLHVGALPSRCDFLLSTKYLSLVHDFDRGNTTIEAGAGITLRDLDAQAREARQFVPLESFAGATLGGVASSNASGARSSKWGAPRDLILGAHAMLSDGRLVRGGGKVVKNVSGYDLPKLFAGARGSLGLLSRLTLRLRPLPERSARTIWTCENLSQVTRLWRILEGREFEWSGLRADFDLGSWTLSAWCEGSEHAVSHQLERAPQADCIEEAEGVECEEAWPEAIQIAARVPRTEAASWLEAAAQTGARRLSWECAGGALRAAWSEVDWHILAALRLQAEGCGGWMIVERCPREWKNWERVWGEKPSAWALMRRLKSAYDEADVCAPGRGVGGL